MKKKKQIKNRKETVLTLKEVLSLLNEVTGNFIALKELLEKIIKRPLNDQKEIVLTEEEIQQFKTKIQSVTVEERDNNYKQDPAFFNFIVKNRIKIEQIIFAVAEKLKSGSKESFLEKAAELFGTEVINVQSKNLDAYNTFWLKVFPLYKDIYIAKDQIREKIESSRLSESDKKRESQTLDSIIENRNNLEESFKNFLENNNFSNLYNQNPISLAVDPDFNKKLNNYVSGEKSFVDNFYKKYFPSSEPAPGVMAPLSPLMARLRRLTKKQPPSSSPTAVFKPGSSRPVISPPVRESLKLKKLSLKEAMEKEYD